MQAYLVGGAVRDRLLNLPIHERDWVVVGSTPAEMIAHGFKPVGRDFPVFLHPETHEEYALARTERKTAPGYHGFTFHAAPDVTLEEDLRRRDLTINAIAEAPDGRLIDPYGGREDLNNGVLRHVAPAFAEDPVRILRTARFAARFARWGFRVAHGTQALMRHMVENGEVDHLVPERVWAETAKALTEDQPARYFEVLARCGALTRLMPEVGAALTSISTHQADTPTSYCLTRLTAASQHTADPMVRFAVLLYDTAPYNALAALCTRLRVPVAYRELLLTVARNDRLARRVAPMSAARVLVILERLDAWRRPERLQQCVLAFALSAGHASIAEDEPASRLSRAAQAATTIRAHELALNHLRGPEVAQAVRRARLAAIATALSG